MIPNRSLTVLFGSQTGTAQDLAERIGREALRYHFDVKVIEMDDFTLRLLPEQSLVVFVCSTTGQGEEPDNMKKFWRFLLRKDLPIDSLYSTSFGVLGLGDSSYTKFNFAAKKLHKRLLQLGAQPLLEPCLGDEQHDMGQDAAVNPWLEEFWKKALFISPLPQGVQALDKDFLPPSRYSVSLINSSTFQGEKTFSSTKDFSAKNPYFASVSENKRVTSADHFQDVRLISFNLAQSGITYSPGDVVMIQPQNLTESVDLFFRIFDGLLNRDQLISLSPRRIESKLPMEWILPSIPSLEDVTRRYWDLQCIPRRSFFELLAHFSTDELEKEKLNELSSAEGQEDLYNYCNRPRRTLIEVIFDFSRSARQVPLDYLFDLIPAIKPRAFSIASSSKANPNQLQILVAIVRYKTKLAEPRQGLCSTWLSYLRPGDAVPIWVRPGTLRFPKDPETPVIMIGPGTGCSPFRSYIQEQVHLGSLQRELCLFFGCRSSKADFFFADEWLPLNANGSLRHLFCAFSRDQPDKIYVQHRMEEQGSLLCQLLLKRGAWIFVAGNAKQMPDQVTQALKTALAINEPEADDYVSEMVKQSRLQFETWS